MVGKMDDEACAKVLESGKLPNHVRLRAFEKLMEPFTPEFRRHLALPESQTAPPIGGLSPAAAAGIWEALGKQLLPIKVSDELMPLLPKIKASVGR
jgi:hypothetical protein